MFPGSFDAEAVAAVAAREGLEAWDVLDAGAGLVAKSMIMADEASGTTRYQMLETLRAFARERLEAGGGLHVMFRRHAEHYTRFAEAADAGLAGPDEVVWRNRVHLEFDNLRAAFIRCLMLGEDDDVRNALRIVAALAFEAVNDRGLGIGVWAEHLVPRVDLASPAVRTAVLAAAAFSAQGRNDVDAMRELAAAALRDGIPPDCPGAVWAYIALAANEGMSGDWDAAVRVIADAGVALRAAGNAPRGLSFLYSAAANFHYLMGDAAAALADAELSLQAARRSQNPTATASAQFAVAVALAHDDPAAAAGALDESIEIGRLGTSGGLLGFALARRAVLRADAGDHAGARRDVREAVKHGHERGDHPMLTSALESAVAVLHELGRDEAAAVVAGALGAGVTTGVARSLTGGMIADLGVAVGAGPGAGRAGRRRLRRRDHAGCGDVARRDGGVRVQCAGRRRARSSVTATGTSTTSASTSATMAMTASVVVDVSSNPSSPRCATGSRPPASRRQSRLPLPPPAAGGRGTGARERAPRRSPAPRSRSVRTSG